MRLDMHAVPQRLITLCLATAALVAAALPMAPTANAQDAVPPSVVISEIFYNPDGPFEGDEFIELFNTGDAEVDVSGWYFDAGVDLVLPADTTIGVNARLVVAADSDDFLATFGFAPAADFAGILSNGGERIALVTADGTLVDEVTYDDAAPWPLSADGDGPSLQILDPAADNDSHLNWGTGSPTPGTASEVDVDVIFSVQRGWYSGGISVALTSTVAGAQIMYNTNGSGRVNQTYNGPISIADNGSIAVIQAQASIGGATGQFATHTYVFKQDQGVPTVAAWNVPIPVQQGESERVMSFEFLPPASTGLVPVQANAGLSTSQAGVSAGQSDKVFFRGDYGNGTLDGDLFSDVYDDNYLAPATEFDQLFLRFEHLDATHQKQLLAHDALLAMGSLAPHGRFVVFHDSGAIPEVRHLHERPEGGFMEAYTDIDKDNWFGSSSVDPPNPNSWAAVQQSFDPVQVNDYMLADWHSQDPDSGDQRNVRAAGPAGNGVGDGDLLRWNFFPWDKDFAYLDATTNPWPYVKRVGAQSTQFMWQSPGSSRQYLHGVEEMRYLMADRTRCAFQPGGGLHPATFQARLVERHDEYRRAGGPDMTGFWVNPMASWLTLRAPAMIGALRGGTSTVISTATGTQLYPNTEPVAITVSNGTLSMASPNGGTIYYRLDGGDPRTSLGYSDPAAIEYTGPISVDVGQTQIIARSFNSGVADRFQAWSPACNEPLTFDVAAANGQPIELQITEINYNPPSEALVDGDLREYIEIHNPGDAAINMGGMRIDGVDLTFDANVTIQPGAYIAVASDAAEFQATYGQAPAAVYPGRLDDSGETVALLDANGTLLDIVTYDDAPPWPLDADAGGASLVVAVGVDNADPANWRSTRRLSPADSNAPLGDVNCGDDLNIVDALVISQFAAGNRTGAPCPHPDPEFNIDEANGDFNNDGNVNIVDALLISQCVVGNINPFCED